MAVWWLQTWRSQGILMQSMSEKTIASLQAGMRVYIQPAWRASAPSQVFPRPAGMPQDQYVSALSMLEREDEEILLPPERAHILVLRHPGGTRKMKVQCRAGTHSRLRIEESRNDK
jgi:hypothetical protein